MSETADKLIDAQYQALFGGVGASAVKKLQAISDYIDEQHTGFFVLEDAEEESKLSKENFHAFLKQLAGAADNLEIFYEMMRIADDREALFLEIIKNKFFANKKNIKAFFENILDNNWINYFRLSEILFEDKENYWVLINEIGFVSVIHDDDAKLVASPVSSNSSVLSAKSASPKSSVFSSSPVLSPVFSGKFVSSLMSPKKQNHQLLQCENELKKGCEPIITRLTAYLKIREENPHDEKSNVNTFRNVFHNKNLTQKKVEDARTLIKTLKEKGVSEFCKKLSESVRWNETVEKQEHTYAFWKSSGGEYGKCLRDCFSIVETKNLTLLQYKKMVIEKLPDDAKKEGKWRKDIIGAQSVEDVMTFLSNELPSVLQDLNEHRTSTNTNLKSPGALKISD